VLWFLHLIDTKHSTCEGPSLCVTPGNSTVVCHRHGSCVSNFISEWVEYKLGMLMYRCQHNRAPRYLMDHCTSVSDVAFCQQSPSLDLKLSADHLWPSGYFVTILNCLFQDMRDPLMWPPGVLCTRSETEELVPRLLRDTSHNTTSFGHSLKTFFLWEY